MNYQAITEIPDSNTIFHDTIFMRNNKHVSEQWIRIGELYPNGAKESLLPETFAREQFGQGSHYECFMLSALATLVKFPDIIRNCFVSRNVRRDGRYTFQFFRDKEWVKVEIDDSVMLEDDEVLFIRSPTSHWWPLLFEKAYAKFYTSYDNLEGCTLQEAYHDLTGNPVLNIPMDARLAKAAGVDVTGGQYWLDLAQKLQSGQFVGSLLTRETDLESMGLQSEQQYGILEIFSLTGTSSVSDIVIHLYNPFEDEEFTYKGPLNSKDTEWTPKLREKYNVDDTHSIFLPLHVALKIVNSVQLCYISPIDGDATYFDDEWKGETAGGNPTSVTWRKNPLYCVRNAGINPVELVVVIKQKDQRRYMSPEERTMYLQCGIVVVQSTTVTQIPTYFVTGNNHKAIHKSLFLNSREVSSFVRIPPNSLCYLVPSCMKKGAESAFTLALYRVKLQDYSNILIKKLEVPSMDWGHCAIGKVTLETKVKERVDFFVDCPTHIHILMHQEKPFVNKVGGDITTRDYVGVYLYDDTDRKIGGVHAATNFRETSVLHRLPRSGRYAISITCPRASGEVPIALTIVGSPDANVRIVEAPDDASMFDDEDDIAEGDEDATVSNPIDYIPVAGGGQVFTEVPDSTVPFEDKRFMVDNKIMTNEPWIHIGDLYPEGKTRSLLPERLSREQFEQGEHFECCCLTAFAALVEHHPNVIRDAFVTKAVRRDGRYTFRFHRYGQWVKVEIDDRIPLLGGKTLFCRSSDGYWWPLLLEKAYAKFYTLYQNIEGCTLRELFYDLTGLPVLSIPMELKLAKAVLCDVDDVSFWVELSEGLKDCACAAVARPGFDDTLGLSNGQEYAVLDVVSLTDGEASSISDLVVKLHNPFLETEYKGPMNASDAAWSSELRTRLCPERRDTIYIPVEVFCNAFLTVEKVMVRGLIVPGWQFNSEWGEGTNGGNPTLVTWRENPIYVVQNTADTPLQIIAMIGQPDQRRVLHLLPEQEVNYVQCGLVLSQCTCSNPVPTYLVTSNNHRVVHKGLFVNFRESANIVTIPANSMSYLIPSAMFRDKTKFLLSYWFQKLPDMKFIKISRINVSVARSLPAIEDLELHNHEKKRVDFLVDVPTDIHILLRQEKPCVTVRTHDAMADDFLGIYLYNEDEKRIDGVTAATNYREMGLVHRLATAGRYALSITCPRGTGVVPCRVEIVGVEDAKVRITDPPEDAGNLCEVDLRFLGSEAEGVPLEDLPLDSDADLQAILEELRRLHGDIDANAESIAKHERMMSDRVHKMARQLLAKDRSKYLPGYDLQTVNSILDAEPHFVVLERDRYHLKCDPRNATKVRNVERSLLTLANEILEKHDDPDLSFLGAEVEGIPTLDLTLMRDSSFSEMARERMQLKRDPIANASRLAEVEDSMVARANAIAKEMHLRERRYLNPEPEGVPLELLPLNEDEVVSEKEDRLRALNRKERKDEKLLRSLEDVIADRVHEIARELKVSERDLFLDPTPGGFPVAQLPLDEDDVFHSLEVERLQLRLRQDSLANKTSEIKELESRLNRRACELARVKVEEGRAFLDPEPLGFPLIDLNLDGDSEFVKLESELRKLRWEPRVNSTAMRTVEEDIARVVHRIALRKTCLDRDYLDAEYEGRPVQGLPLNDSKEVLAMETRRRVLINAKADRDEIGVAENMIRDAVREIARALNVGERLDYLEPCPRGVPVEDLPLDMDTEFHELEVHRQRLKCDAKKQDTVIMDVERALNDRAEALAREHLSSDRGYLDPASVGVPLRLLPLDSDSVFQELEIKRALLKKNPQRNGRAISDLEGGLNERAHVLATEMKHAERSKFMDPNPGGIAIEDVPIDNDEVFCDLEIRRFGLCEDRHANIAAIRNLEDAMNERVIELADKMRCEIRMFLDPMPLGVSLDELPLDNNETFVAKEAELHKLRKDLRANGADVALLKSDLNELAKQMAAEMISKDRAFLFPEPEGRLLEELPLDSDKEFRSLEKQLRLLCKESPPEAQKIAAIEELLDGRAHQLAKMKNCAERKDYLDSHPCGVPLDDVPLDNDDEFSMLEVKRAALMRDVVGNKDSIASVEKALNGRAEKLALLKLRSERSFLDPEPHGIPLHCVPLDDDDSFHLLEVERLTLKGLNIRENDHKLVGVENAMRDYVNDLALEVKRKMREDVLDTSPDGLPLSVLPLDNDLPFIELENGYIKAVFDAKDTLKIQDLAGAMRRRSEDIARKLRSDVRLSLEQHPLGFTLDELPVDDSELFLGKERELLELKRDGRYNSPTAIEIMEELNSIILDIAKEQAIREREFLDQEPEGRHITELNLDSDTTFLGLERQRRLLKKDPFADRSRIVDLEQMLNDRSHELAKKLNSLDRPKFLPVAIRGVLLSELPLDSDAEFTRLEVERSSLYRDPVRNASTINHVEEALNIRVAAMADEVVRQDRMFLGEDVEGVCVRHLPLDDDAEFRALETKRATYKSCGSRMGTKAIKDLEDQLGDRAAELARTAKKELRNLLGTEPLGVPLSDLPIDVDGRFRALEDNYRDLSRNSANGGKLCEIILQLNERALELAAELHTKERVVLSQCPGGIPLSALALNEDEMFKALEMEARKLRHSTAGRGRNAARISELESAMNERAMELANQLRRTYCDAAPEGIPLELLGLGGVEEFTKLEDALRDATKDPVKNREIISDIEFELNSRAHVAAMGLLEGDRDYLECETMEVPLSDLPLNTDSVFRALEVERAVLKLREPHRGARRVRELELKLVERAHRLAEELKEEDLSGLDGEPEGVSLRALKPHNDSLFSEFVGAMRELKRGPKRNTVAIEELRERMNERAHELAQEKLKDDREFLDQCPEGVPLSDLPLGTDPLFHKLETERARLKERDAARNITHIHELESRLKDRAVELANEQKGRDLSELEQSPCGVPIYILQLHDDPVLQKMLNKMRGLRNRGVTGPEFVALIDEINNCARDAAEELLLRDREYLEPEPLGVPLSLLSLTTDTVFHGLEVQRAVLKAQNARRNAAKISDFEMRLNERAVQLAEVQRQRELEGLDPEPEGIPISVLNPHGDAEFIKLVTELRQLCSEGNNEGMCDVLKTTMNDVVHALAKRLKEGDRGYLDPEPEGVPLCVLPLDTDVLFFRLECERVTLKARNAHLNARRICELEDALNNRAVELAREQLRQDVDGVDEAPCGIPLQLLRLHEDSTFLVMVDDIRTLRKNPDANSEAIDAVVMSMNDRAYDVAIAQFDRGFLDPEPEGVPLCILPLDDDELFHGMEVERIKLKLTDARRNAQTIGTLEEEMNGRAHELALQQLREELSGIDAAPEGIPLSLLRVMEDPAFALMVLELRDLKKDTQGNAERIREVEDAMNNRAYELADGLLEGDRSYLDPIPLGVPVSELPLCSDEPFATMEVERARLKAEDARRNAAGIGELELKLNNRAKELASEQLLRDLEGFHDEYEGIDLVHLRPHDDKEFASLVPELRRLKRDGDKEAVEQHMRSMDRRLRELAKELVGGDLWFLDKEPEGVPLTYLPLDGDEILDKLRHERAQLKIQDPRGNADRIAELERKMNERIHDLAKCIGDEDFDGVEGEPCGIPLSLLSPRDDEVVAKLINDIRKVKYSTEEKSSNGALNNLQVELSKRVHQLAEDVLIRDRVKYLNQCPESVDISFLPLSTDEQFRALELERVIINIQSNGDDKRLDGLEDMLNKRAHELAKEQLQEDLRGLEQAPHGVPLDVLKPHSDLRFIKEAEQLRNLKRDPLRNKREIDDLVEQMNNTVGEIALNLLRSDRDYLHLAPEGVPIEVLPLEVDAKFCALEAERAMLKGENNPKNASMILSLEEKLNERARQLAQEQLLEDLKELSSFQHCVPLSLLSPHTDVQFAADVAEFRRLKKEGEQNTPAIQGVVGRLNARANELAEEYLRTDRASYLNPEQLGVPLDLLSLDTDSEFVSLEAERLKLLSYPAVNNEQITRLEAELNACAKKLLVKRLYKERNYLDREPLGVSLNALPLDTDSQFHFMELKRLALKAGDPYCNEVAINTLEERLSDRAYELARGQIAEDLSDLISAPRGIPVSLLHPHNDPEFHEMVVSVRLLKRDSQPDLSKLMRLVDDLNRRVKELADCAVGTCRRKLNPLPEGIPLQSLPLDEDPLFSQMERDLVSLFLEDEKKNATRITKLEDRLNERAANIAVSVKAKDLEQLEQTPCGIPIELLRPHEDSTFASLANQYRISKHLGGSDSHGVNVGTLNKRATEIAIELLRGDQSYIDRQPCGVPFSALELEKDPQFRDLQVQRMRMVLSNPKRNLNRITELEVQLNSYVQRCAQAFLAADRGFVDKEPGCVPLAELDLDNDPLFHRMEVERAKLKIRGPVINAYRIRNLEEKLNDRAHELAEELLATDLEGIAPEPEGVLLASLHPHDDAECASLIAAKRRLLKEPSQNMEKIRDVQEKLNNRVFQLAREVISKLRKQLVQEPEGIPLEFLPLDADNTFRSMERDLLALQATPRRNDIKVEALRGSLNERACELARGQIQCGRGFLNPQPEGVDLEHLPLDENVVFRSKEVERTKLKRCPHENAAAITQLESDLNALVHSIAKDIKLSDRAFLNLTSHGIPRELLPLDEDRSFTTMERRRRRLKRDGNRRATAMMNLEEMMQDRVDDLAFRILRGDRGNYVTLPDGIDAADIPIDTDERFGTLELRRAVVMLQGSEDCKEQVGKLEHQMSERLQELVRKRVKEDRDFLDPEPEGIPLKDIPLDSDAEFRHLEARRRKIRRESRRRVTNVADLEEAMNDRAHVLARCIVAEDVGHLRPDYRRIPTNELHLHNDDTFRSLASKRRELLQVGAVTVDIAAIEDDMDIRALQVADDVVAEERAFLDPQPGGMFIVDLQLDEDETFFALERERRRMRKDFRFAKRNKEAINDLEVSLNERACELAREAFSKQRDFMDQEPEGIPLKELPLDNDLIFKDAEISRYVLLKDPKHAANELIAFENVMNCRAHELAKEIIAKDRDFLDLEPDGVPREELPLDTDERFQVLAQEHFRLKRLNGNLKSTEVRVLEEKMNDRLHELAKEFLQENRSFLDSEPEGVPIADVPFRCDPTFVEIERELLKLSRNPVVPDSAKQIVRDLLNKRLHEIAAAFLKKERIFLDPEPFGLPLACLPLNYDHILNLLERKRRALKKNGRGEIKTIRSLEEEIQDRVNVIAVEYLEMERSFLDPRPRGVPLTLLPLNGDWRFRSMEVELRALRKNQTKNRKDIEKIEGDLNLRATELAGAFLQKHRVFIDPEPLGVPIEELPLDSDSIFHNMESMYLQMGRHIPRAAELRRMEEEMNDRVRELATEHLQGERAFLNQKPQGIPLCDLSLNNDRQFRDMEKRLRALRKHPRSNTEGIKTIQDEMNQRVNALARRKISDDRSYLPLELHGVPVYDIPLDDDREFRDLEVKRHRAKILSPEDAVLLQRVEEELVSRALDIAKDFVWRERSFLDSNPQGVPIIRLPLSTDEQFRELETRRRHLKKDPRNAGIVALLEQQLRARAHELAEGLLGWQDVQFHEANHSVAEMWPRIGELYPEGIRNSVFPEITQPGDTSSAPGELGYLAPFIAALSQHPPLIHRLLETKTHPVNGPYSFIFFDPNSNPVRVDIDDRVPVDAKCEPKFTRVPHRSWYPLLLEKAYAKFVGGYAKLDQCTPHETLHDLTGRPVTHIPFDEKRADGIKIGDFRSVKFWKGIKRDLAAGDVIMAMTNGSVPDGLHSQCSYALLSVIETVHESNDVSDIVIKLHNCYYDSPTYDGPLCNDDDNWTDGLKRLCHYNPEEDALYIPVPVFLRNFSSMQRCHINCGDRLTAPGEWTGVSCGGNPKFTTFRNNPIYLVENKTSRPVTILAELRHHAPAYRDPDDVNHYHQSGLALLKAINTRMPVSPILTSVTHRFLHRGMMLDAREVCAQMELPPSTTCYLVPYTLGRDNYGKFHISVYPGLAKVNLAPLRSGGLHRDPVRAVLDVITGCEGGTRTDFTVSAPCDVHILLRQSEVRSTDYAHKSDVIGEEDLTMSVYNDSGIKVASTGCATNCLEQALVFRVPQQGRYSAIVQRLGVSKAPLYRCDLFVYTSRCATACFVPVSVGLKPLKLGKCSALPPCGAEFSGTSNGVNCGCNSLLPLHSAPYIKNGNQ